MATLGELLFYVATTQQDMAGTSTVKEVADLWQINAGTVSAVTRLLKPQEDEVAQHYAVKTIENICSQGGEWAAKFCSEDVVYNLVQVYYAAGKANQENLKSTAASTLARLLRHSPALVAFIIDKAGMLNRVDARLDRGFNAVAAMGMGGNPKAPLMRLVRDHAKFTFGKLLLAGFGIA